MIEEPPDRIPSNLERTRVPWMDDHLGIPFQVLDQGFIRIIDYMGDDSSIVQAARVSYQKGTKQLRQDRGLIRYLMRMNHSTPFEMAEIKIHVKVPMDAWRQWIRTRTASTNEYSTRYSLALEECQTTTSDSWRSQAIINRQGSGDLLPERIGSDLTTSEKNLINLSWETYHQCLDHGVAREQARKNLLLSTYTEAYWKIDLHNLLNFLRLRMDSHAQLEIRQYANQIAEIIKNWVPLTWEAFEDYVLNSMKLSKLDTEIITLLNQGLDEEAIEKARQFGWLDKREDGTLKNIGERVECEEKLLKLGLPSVWLNSWRV